MNMKKVLALALALVLIVGATVAGTVAWLMDSTGEVVNTFTAGNINIDLAETVDNEFKILPGTEETKDPVVTVEANSEDCWVFIQVKEENNVAAVDGNGVTTHEYFTWAIDSNYWTKLSDVNGIVTYYANTKYETIASDVSYNVLANQKVAYSDQLTKDMIDKLYNTDGTIKTEVQPKLSFKAFAVQAEAGTDAITAWATVPTSEYLGATA